MLKQTNIWIFFINMLIKSEIISSNIRNEWNTFDYFLRLLPRKQLDNERGFDLNDEDMRKFHIWPLGVIPYFIDDYSFDKVLRDKIRVELHSTNKITGLRFMELPRPPDDETTRWLFFVNRKGQQDCADLSFKNFTTEGVQKIVLGYQCLTDGNFAEIILAIVGVPPQHNAPNRNEFIKVHEKNILPNKLYLYQILKDDEWLFHDMEYDIVSAGHYQPHQHTANGAATITILKPYVFQPKIQTSSSKLSFIDIQKIKRLYNFISRHRYRSNPVKACDKLFKPGANISNFKMHEESIMQLKKPNKYLGIENVNITQSEENKPKNSNATLEEGESQSLNGNVELNDGDIPSEEVGPQSQNKTGEPNEDEVAKDHNKNPANIYDQTERISEDNQNNNLDENYGSKNNATNKMLDREFHLHHPYLERSDYETDDERNKNI